MKSKNTFVGPADAQKEQQRAEYAKLVDEIRERNRKREQEATFTEIWYTFVDPYATDVDERGTGQFKSNNYFFFCCHVSPHFQNISLKR